MPLAGKILCSVGVPVALLVWAASANLSALDRASAESRNAFARIGPALREAGETSEGLEALTRLHVRWSILPDAGYAGAWETRMRRLEGRLAAFRATLDDSWQRKLGTKAARAVARYRELSAIDAGGVTDLRALSIAERRRASRASARATRALEGLVGGLTAAAARADATAAAVARRAWDATVAVACLAGLLALGLSSWTAWRIARGLGRLTQASIALERGRLDQPVAIGGHDELARLASAFESLATGLRERDQVSEHTLRRVGRDLAEPLMTIRDAAERLAAEGSPRLEARQGRLVALIGEATERLLRRTARMGDDAPAVAHVPSLEAPAPRLLTALGHPDEP